MGTKFANIQVMGLQPQQAQELVSGVVVRRTHPAWLTLLHPSYQLGAVEKAARALSKRIDNTVVSVGYFDDDIFSLQVFQNGKLLLCHNSSPVYGYKKTAAKPAALAGELGLAPEDAESLKWILKCERCDEQVALLENLWGTQLWVDYDWLEEDGGVEGEEEPFTPNRIAVDEYVHKAKAITTKIRSKTRATVIQEFVAQVQCGNHDSQSDYLTLPGKTETQLYFPAPDGTLNPFNARNLPLIEVMGGTVLCAGEYIGVLCRDMEFSEWALYGSNGTEIWHGQIEGDIYHACLCPDGTLVASLGFGLKAINVDGTERWRKAVAYLYTQPIWHNGYLYYHQRDAMMCLNITDGSIMASCPLDGDQHYTQALLPVGRWLYHAYNTRNAQGKGHTFLLRFEDNLTCTHTLLNEANGDHVSQMMSGPDNSIWMRLLGRALLRVNGGVGVRAYAEQTGIAILQQSDAAGRLVVQKGESGIEVYDAALQLVGRHRLKGSIRRSWLDADGMVCLMACEGQNYERRISNCTVRVYRLS